MYWLLQSLYLRKILINGIENLRYLFCKLSSMLKKIHDLDYHFISLAKVLLYVCISHVEIFRKKKISHVEILQIIFFSPAS